MAPSIGLDRDGGERIVEVGLGEPAQLDARRIEPVGKAGNVVALEHHEVVRGRVPVGVDDRVIAHERSQRVAGMQTVIIRRPR